ncbi:hypothetical protein PT2222_390041 [Paraburkholderia tropica]
MNRRYLSSAYGIAVACELATGATVLGSLAAYVPPSNRSRAMRRALAGQERRSSAVAH